MVHRLIAHLITKTQNTLVAQETLASILIPAANRISEQLVTQVRKGFTQGNPQLGKFSIVGEAKPQFLQLLEGAIAADLDTDFIQFSRNATRLMRGEMEKELMATGGYLVFIDHEQSGENFFLVVLLTTTQGSAFDNNLQPVEHPVLDFQHIRHAARIRTAALANNEDGCVSFISKSRDGAADYFKESLGCVEITNSKRQARSLFSAIEELAAQLQIDKTTALRRAHDYWQDCREDGRQMKLTEVAAAVAPDNQEAAIEILGQEERGMAGEFAPPPPSYMKAFVDFDYESDGLKIVFTRDGWLANVEVPDNATIIISNAPEDMIEQIRQAKAE